MFTTQTAEKIAQALLNSGARAKRIKFKKFRYSEAGDFKSQKDVNKLTDICRILTANGIPCSGYTARTDLDLNDLLKVTTVNVSNDKGGWQEQGANRFKTVESYSKDAIKCLGNCRICSICERYKGQTIEVLNH